MKSAFPAVASELSQTLSDVRNRMLASRNWSAKFWIGVIADIWTDLRQSMRKEAATVSTAADEVQAILADGQVTREEQARLDSLAQDLAAAGATLDAASRAG